jgi:YgiT-type zinc finger domain-containing protein
MSEDQNGVATQLEVATKNAIQNSVVCDVCGKEGAKVRRVPMSYGKGEALLVIENVPVVICPTCRDRHFTEATLQKIDQIKANRVALSAARPVFVATFV